MAGTRPRANNTDRTPTRGGPGLGNASEPQGGGARATGLFITSVSLCAVGLVSCLLLAMDHFGAMSLPGCGPGSACAAAAKSVWGKVLGVPLSFIGMAHFAGVGMVLLLTRALVGPLVLMGILLAAACSLVYAGIAVGSGLVCGYCMVVHAANLSIAGVVAGLWLHSRELAIGLPGMARGSSKSGLGGARAGGQPGKLLGRTGAKPVVMGVLVTGAVYLVLIPLDVRVKAARRDLAEAQLAQTQQEIATAGGSEAARSSTETVRVEPKVSAGDAQAGDGESGNTGNASVGSAKTAVALTGRYRAGPAAAAVRIVVFTDYQCPDCYSIEQELKGLMEANKGMSVAVRYFPLGAACNPAMNGQDMHPNACWAARAAETAGMLKGVEGFWAMHKALFDRRGSFTDAELPGLVSSLGYEPRLFQQIMTGPDTAARVKQDVDAATAMGIYFTPMIFINGVEMRGWQAPKALTRAVASAFAANPTVADGSEDRAPDARAKYMADWMAQPVLKVPESVTRRMLGPADAAVEVIMFGDMTEKNTVDADGILRLFTEGAKPNIRYTFAHFPVNSECNPSTTMKTNPRACRVAKASEVVAAMAGPEAYWAFHNYVMSHQAELAGAMSEQTLAEAIAAAGLDAAEVLAALDEPFAADSITSDAAVAKALGIRGVPMILINGRLVPRWKLNNENMLAAMIIDAAAGEGEPAGK